MSSLAQPMIAPHSSVTSPTTTTAVWAAWLCCVDEVRADDEVDARGHHRRRVDERRDRGRAFHGVEQPALQGHLGGLAAGAQQQQQAERGGGAGRHLVHAARRRRRTTSVPNVVNISMIASAMPMSPTRLTMNAFLAATAAAVLLLPEADQQVRRQADAFPADEQRQVVGREHQR